MGGLRLSVDFVRTVGSSVDTFRRDNVPVVSVKFWSRTLNIKEDLNNVEQNKNH